jgi:hypothetical protein
MFAAATMHESNVDAVQSASGDSSAYAELLSNDNKANMRHRERAQGVFQNEAHADPR